MFQEEKLAKKCAQTRTLTTSGGDNFVRTGPPPLTTSHWAFTSRKKEKISAAQETLTNSGGDNIGRT